MRRVLLLPLLLLAAAASVAPSVRAAPPPLTGAKCECFQTNYEYTDPAENSSVTITAKCQLHTSYTGTVGTQCNCYGVNTGCGHVVVTETLQLTGVAADAHIANTSVSCHGVPLTNGTVETFGACVDESGVAACHNSTSETTEQYVGVNSFDSVSADRLVRVCARNTYYSPCSSDAPCATDPVNCAYTIGEFGPCSEECGGGVHTAPLILVQEPLNGGRACPTPFTVSKKCNEDPCPVDCVVTEWSPWSNCSIPCGDGGGTQSRSRAVTRPADHGGADCPHLNETRACDPAPEPCPVPVDCVVSDWGAPGPCSVACGVDPAGGTQTLTRTVLTAPEHGGAACPALSTTQTCNALDQCDPQDCVVSQGAFGPCSVTCGNGTQTAVLTVTTAPHSGGEACPVPLSVTQECATGVPCPVDCVMGDWTPFSACSVTCGTGVEVRSRPIITPAQHGGAACGNTSESRECPLQPCPAVDCEVGDFGDWSVCPVECGGNANSTVRLRSRPITVAPDGEGAAPCPALVETEPCGRDPCPVDCVISNYSAPSECTQPCGTTGTQVRTATVLVDPLHGGVGCPETRVEEPCNLVACRDQDCQMGNFTEWSACAVNGTRTRVQEIEHEASDASGTVCPSLAARTYTEACQFVCAPPESEWGEWSACVNGTQTRTRECAPAGETGLEDARDCTVGGGGGDDAWYEEPLTYMIAGASVAGVVGTSLLIWKREELCAGSSF